MKIQIPENLSFIKKHFSGPNQYLVKLGGFKDGGYVADYFSLIRSKVLISGGVGSNVRFESDFYDINQSVKIVLVDPTVSVIRMIIRGFYHFMKKGQSGFRSLSEVMNYFFLIQYSKLIKKYLGSNFGIQEILSGMNLNTTERNIFVKLDIEGAEYDLLDNIIALKENLTGVCIEFHDLHQEQNRVNLQQFLEQLQFTIVHVSVNEVCVTGNNYPSVLEISLAPKTTIANASDQQTPDELYLQASNTFDNELIYFIR
jgi:hypothetical protein